MLKIYGPSAIYRLILQKITHNQNPPHAFNMMVIHLNRHITEHYITLSLWLIVLAVNVTCLVQTEPGGFYFLITCIFTLWLGGPIAIKVIALHRFINALLLIRKRLWHCQDWIIEFNC